MGKEEGEREKGEERCSATTANTLQMNNRVRSVIPPRRLLHWQAGGSSCISVWKQLRVSTQPARGLRSLSGEPALSSHIPSHLHCFYSLLPLSPPILHACSYVIVLRVGSSLFWGFSLQLLGLRGEPEWGSGWWGHMWVFGGIDPRC